MCLCEIALNNKQCLEFVFCTFFVASKGGASRDEEVSLVFLV